MHKDLIRKKIENGQLRDALEDMKSCWQLGATQLLMQFNVNETAKMMGTISFEEFFRINNQVTFNALSMLSTPSSCDEKVEKTENESFSMPADASSSANARPEPAAKKTPAPVMSFEAFSGGASGTTQKDPLKVVISYSHKDEEFREMLDTHLTILERAKKIKVWNDRDLTPGEEWNEKIYNSIVAADIIILLVSGNFIASEFIWNNELPLAMSMHENGHATVIPIIIKSCEWKDAPFSRLQCLPKNGAPVAKWADRDEPMAEIAKAIRGHVDRKLA